jgi:hypothetical protein
MLLGVILAAQAAAVAPAGLTPFDPFVGSCWATDFSATLQDVHCFETMYGGAHVRDRHEVKENGKIIYAGETIYSRNGKGLSFTYFNSLGGIGRGTVEPGGSTLRFKGSMRGSPDKPPQQIDSEWRILDNAHYDVRSLVRSASTAGNAVLHFRRVK